MINDFEEKIQTHIYNHEFQDAFVIIKKLLNSFSLDIGNGQISPILDTLESFLQTIQDKLEKSTTQTQERKFAIVSTFELMGELYHVYFHHKLSVECRNFIFPDQDDSLLKDIDSLLEELDSFFKSNQTIDPYLEKSLQSLNKALIISEEITTSKTTDILSSMSHLYINAHQYDKAIHVSERLLSIYREIDSREKEGSVLSDLGWFTWYISMFPSDISEDYFSFDQIEKYYEESLKIGLDIADHNLVARNYLGMSGLHWYSYGNPKLGADFMKKANDYYRKADNKIMEVFTVYMLAHNHLDSYNLDFAISCINEGMKTLESLPHDHEVDRYLSLLLSTTGLIKIAKGSLDEAIEDFQEAHEKLANSQHPPHQHFVNFWSIIARINIYKKEYKEALSWIRKAAFLVKNNLTNRYSANFLYSSLIDLTIDLNKEKYSQRFLEYMKANSLRRSDSKTTLSMQEQYLLSKAKFLAEKPRLKDKVSAQDTIEQILVQEFVFDRKIVWCEVVILKIKLDIFELRSTGELDILAKIKDSINELQQIVNSLGLWNLYGETLLFSVELQIIEGNYQQAEKYLNQAEEIGKIHQITHMNKRIGEERKKIVEKIVQSKELIRKNASLVERVNKSELNDFIEKAKKEIQLQSNRGGF